MYVYDITRVDLLDFPYNVPTYTVVDTTSLHYNIMCVVSCMSKADTVSKGTFEKRGVERDVQCTPTLIMNGAAKNNWSTSIIIDIIPSEGLRFLTTIC